MGGATGERLNESLAASLLPERDARGHKGTFGRATVVAGSMDYAGAALMAGAAALRAGAGLVTLYVPVSLQPHIVGRMPELITRGLPETAAGEVDAVPAAAEIIEQQHDALLIGPGLAPGRGTNRLVAALLGSAGSPATIDASALDSLAASPRHWDRVQRRAVLTPHPGEFRRLGIEPGSSDEERRDAALRGAAEWKQVVVLKGAGTVVAAPDGRVLVAPFSLPILATAGSGDVLAGMVTSFLAQGLQPFEAAALAVYVHGSAGEHISERIGDAGMLATDLLPELPRVRRHLDHLRQREAGSRLDFDAPARAER